MTHTTPHAPPGTLWSPQPEAKAKRERPATAGIDSERVAHALRDGQYRTLAELHDRILDEFGVMYGEGAIRARISEMHLAGTHVRDSRPRPGSRAWEYRLTPNAAERSGS